MSKKCIPLLILLLFFICCQTNNSDSENNVINISGDYLGESLPGLSPVQFAADILPSNEDWHWHGPPVFSLDGRELYWAAHYHDPNDPPDISVLYMEVIDGVWTEPRELMNTLPLEGINPFLSIDGNRLYFYAGSFWFMERISGNRIENSWSGPTSLGETFTVYPMGFGGAISENSTIYFSFQIGSIENIYYSELNNGEYSEYERMSNAVNSIYDTGAPCIAHDESFIVFVSTRPEGFGMSDLYVSFHNLDGTWTDAINLGSEFNSPTAEGWPG